jgi:hypothetical protein
MREHSEVKAGDPVLVHNVRGKAQQGSVVQQTDAPRTYLVEFPNGTRSIRNRRFLTPLPRSQPPKSGRTSPTPTRTRAQDENQSSENDRTHSSSSTLEARTSNRKDSSPPPRHCYATRARPARPGPGPLSPSTSRQINAPFESSRSGVVRSQASSTT